MYLSDFPFLCLSSGHKISTLSPRLGRCENQMKSPPWKCLVAELSICSLREDAQVIERKQNRELARLDHLLRFQYCRRLQNLLKSSQHLCRQVFALLYTKEETVVGWSTILVCPGRGISWDIDFQCQTLESFSQVNMSCHAQLKSKAEQFSQTSIAVR